MGRDNWCFVDLLFESFFEQGEMRCNLKIDEDLSNPQARHHRDKILELVETDHTAMMLQMLDRMIEIRSNRLDVDTLHYLMLRVGHVWDNEFMKNFIWREIRDGDPERVGFVEDAAARQDFRSVLRTNQPCSDDAVNYFRQHSQSDQ